MRISGVNPSRAVPGGVVRVDMVDLADPRSVSVLVGTALAPVIGASSKAITLRLPEAWSDHLLVQADSDLDKLPLNIGQCLADDLHAVSNPAVDSKGNVYVTYSGARGEKVPFSVFRVDPEGNQEPYLTGIVNATGLALGPDHCLYISSRHEGTIYRSTPDKQVDEFVVNAGTPTGIAFDGLGNLWIGDRAGRLLMADRQGRLQSVCDLEPSVSAYHLAFGPDGHLYLTGPTLSTRDAVYRISPEGLLEVFFRGLGRPQGLTFGRDGTLQVAASYRGRKGIFSILRGDVVRVVAGPMLVGLAYAPDFSRLFLVDNHRLFVLGTSSPF